MNATSSHSRKLAPILVFFITFLLILFLSLPWVSAEEETKPKPQQWQINGIVAALDDGYDEVKKYALDKLNQYDTKEINKPEKNKIIEKIANILKDKEVNSNVRSRAAVALGNFGEAAAKYIPDIVTILKDEKLNSYARYGAAQALGNFGEAAATYIPDILNILKKDEKLNSSYTSARYDAARALGNFGTGSQIHP